MLFLTSSVACFFISGSAKIMIFLMSAAALVFTSILSVLRYHSIKKKYAFLILILCLIMTLLSALSSYLFFDRNEDNLAEIYGKESYVQGIVTKVNYANHYSSEYTVSINSIDGDEADHKAILKCDYPGALYIGDRIAVTAKAEKPEANEGRYNEKLSYLSEGIFIVYTSDDESELALSKITDDYLFGSKFELINHKLSSILTNTIDGDEGDLSSALLLGNKNLLSDTIRRDFRRVGASHILALSGLHMSLIMGAFAFFLKFFIHKITPRAIILSCIALFYLALTGFSVSATRSVIMLLIVYLSLIIFGISDSLTSLSVAGALIVFFSPGAVIDAAFWMSFSSTLGILVFIPPINDFCNEFLAKNREKKLKYLSYKLLFRLLTAIATTLAALIPLVIVMCIFIKEISVFSIISSIALSVPTAVIIILSLLLLPTFNIPYISSFIAGTIRIMGKFMIEFCARLSEYENTVISLNYPFANAMAVILGIALFIALALKLKKRKYISLVPFALCVLVCFGLMFSYEKANSDKLNLAYINTSSRSDMIVLSAENQAIICDMSNGSTSAYEYALEEIYESRVTEIRAVMLTRYTNLHNLSLRELFGNNMIRELWIPYPTNISEFHRMERVFDIAEIYNVATYVYKSGETMMAFDTTYITHKNTYIDRSTVPIDFLSIHTYNDHFTYTSPSFIESDLAEEVKYAFSKSEYVVFGCRGPKTKTPYELNKAHILRKTSAVVFANKTAVAFFVEPEFSFIKYYLVPEKEKIEFYLDK